MFINSSFDYIQTLPSLVIIEIDNTYKYNIDLYK